MSEPEPTRSSPRLSQAARRRWARTDRRVRRASGPAGPHEPVVPDGLDAHQLAGLRGVDDVAAADVHAHVADATEPPEEEVAGLEVRQRDVGDGVRTGPPRCGAGRRRPGATPTGSVPSSRSLAPGSRRPRRRARRSGSRRRRGRWRLRRRRAGWEGPGRVGRGRLPPPRAWLADRGGRAGTGHPGQEGGVRCGELAAWRWATSVPIWPFTRARVACWFATVACAALAGVGGLGQRRLGLALCRLELALLGGEVGLGHAQGVDGARDVAARHRLVLAGDGGLLAPRAEQRLQVVVARCPTCTRPRPAWRRLVVSAATWASSCGDGGLDLRDLLTDLLHLLLGRVVLLGGGVEASAGPSPAAP